MYKVDIRGLEKPLLKWLSGISDESNVCHKSLGHVSFSTINKLISKELVIGLPEGKISKDQVCDAYAQGKHIRSSFQPIGMVIISNP